MPAILETKNYSIHHLHFDDDIIKLILHERPSVCVLSQTDGIIRNEALQLLEKIKQQKIALNRPIKDPTFRIILVAFESGIPTRNWGDLGVHEIMIAPVLPKALAFKLSRHHQKAITAFEIEKLSIQEPSQPIFETELQEQKPPTEWRSFIQKNQDPVFPPQGLKKDKITFTISSPLLPKPETGEWSQEDTDTKSDTKLEKKWQWSEKKESNKKPKWSFEGDKPEYSTKKEAWSFSGSSPKLQKKDYTESKEQKTTDVVIYSQREKALKVLAEFENKSTIEVFDAKKLSFFKKEAIQISKPNFQRSDTAINKKQNFIQKTMGFIKKQVNLTTPTESNLKPEKQKKLAIKLTNSEEAKHQDQAKDIEAQKIEEFLELNFDLSEIEYDKTETNRDSNTTDVSDESQNKEINLPDIDETTALKESLQKQTPINEEALSKILKQIDEILPTDSQQAETESHSASLPEHMPLDESHTSNESNTKAEGLKQSVEKTNEKNTKKNDDEKNNSDTSNSSHLNSISPTLADQSNLQKPTKSSDQKTQGETKFEKSSAKSIKNNHDGLEPKNTSISENDNLTKNQSTTTAQKVDEKQNQLRLLNNTTLGDQKSETNLKQTEQHSTWSMGDLDTESQKTSSKKPKNKIDQTDKKTSVEFQKNDLNEINPDEVLKKVKNHLEASLKNKSSTIKDEEIDTDKDWVSKIKKLIKSLFQ